MVPLTSAGRVVQPHISPLAGLADAPAPATGNSALSLPEKKGDEDRTQQDRELGHGGHQRLCSTRGFYLPQGYVPTPSQPSPEATLPGLCSELPLASSAQTRPFCPPLPPCPAPSGCRRQRSDGESPGPVPQQNTDPRSEGVTPGTCLSCTLALYTPAPSASSAQHRYILLYLKQSTSPLRV